MMDLRTDRQKREAAAYQFELQANRLYLSILKRLPNFRYLVRDEMKGQDLTVMVLNNSFDFYELRLNRGKHRIDLLAVQMHDAVVPLPTICLANSREYDAGQPPYIERPGAKIPNHREVKLLVSKLLLGTQEAEEALQRMHPRTRQRYLQRCREYLKPRVGRPIAS